MYFLAVNIGFWLSVCWGKGGECMRTFCAVFPYKDFQLFLLSSAQLATPPLNTYVDSELSTTLRSWGWTGWYFPRGSLTAYHMPLHPPPMLSVNTLLSTVVFQNFYNYFVNGISISRFLLLVPQLVYSSIFFFLISVVSQEERAISYAWSLSLRHLWNTSLIFFFEWVNKFWRDYETSLRCYQSSGQIPWPRRWLSICSII